jgi:hypothetical protein
MTIKIATDDTKKVLKIEPSFLRNLDIVNLPESPPRFDRGCEERSIGYSAHHIGVMP